MCPEYDPKTKVDNNELQCFIILKNLVKEIFLFCNKYKIVSVSLPPMSTGILNFPNDLCARAFFEGMMDYLDEVDLISNVKDIRIVIFDPDDKERAKKLKDFQNCWESCFLKKFGHHMDEDSDDEKEENEKKEDEKEEDQKEEDKKATSDSKGNKVNGKSVKFNKKIEDDSSSSDDPEEGKIDKKASKKKSTLKSAKKSNSK